MWSYVHGDVDAVLYVHGDRVLSVVQSVSFSVLYTNENGLDHYSGPCVKMRAYNSLSLLTTVSLWTMRGLTRL